MYEFVMDKLILCWFFAALTGFAGLYCMLVSRNLLRLLIGVEILSKACILAVIASGWAMGNITLAQEIAISMIVIEVVVAAVGLMLIILTYYQTGTLDLWKLNKLKG